MRISGGEISAMMYRVQGLEFPEFDDFHNAEYWGESIVCNRV